VSKFVAASGQLTNNPAEDRFIQRTLEQLRSEIKLQLNPAEDATIILSELLDGHPIWIEDTRGLYDAVFPTNRKVIEITQEILGQEWQKVKNEAIKGDLREEEQPSKVTRFFRAMYKPFLPLAQLVKDFGEQELEALANWIGRK